MNLYIFQYDNEIDCQFTHWVEARTEAEGRRKLKGRDEYGSEQLDGSYKLVGTFPLAEPQIALKPKETAFTGIPADKAEEFARSIMDFAQRNQMDCPSINDMAALILGTHPQPYPKKLPDDGTWQQKAAAGIYHRICTMMERGQKGVPGPKELTQIIERYARSAGNDSDGWIDRAMDEALEDGRIQYEEGTGPHLNYDEYQDKIIEQRMKISEIIRKHAPK